MAFLREQFAAEEQEARAAAAMPGGVAGDRWRVAGSHTDEGGTYWRITTANPDVDRVQTIELVGGGMSGGGAHTEEVAAHIARHDPARVLADTAAKRAIVALHGSELVEVVNADRDERSGYWCTECDGEEFPCRTLRVLAVPYTAVEGYRPEWAPAT